MKLVKALQGRQLFFMKKDNLMKRVSQYFEQTNNAAEVVEYLVAILLRDALCVEDYSLESLTDLIRQIFLTAEPNDTLRRHVVYFKKFLKEDWQTVIDRLFLNEAEYQAFTKQACLYNEFLERQTRRIPKASGEKFNTVAIFKDADGKKYTWTLRDTKEISVDSTSQIEEVAGVLQILTTLTIFRSMKGVRRFAEFLEYYTPKASITVSYKVPQAEVLVPASDVKQTDEPQTTQKPEKPASSINSSKTPQNTTKPATSKEGKNTLSYDKLMDKNEAMYQLGQAAPPVEPKGCSAAPNPAETEKPPAKNSDASPKKIDASPLRYGKTEEQIKQKREEKTKNNRIAKELDKRGKGSKNDKKKRKGKRKKKK